MSDSNSTAGAASSGTGAGGAVSNILPSYDNTLGAILIGCFVSVFLYGVTCLQVFIYYQRYPRDRRSVKNLVYLIWMIDSLDAALTVQICYFYLVSNYANPVAIFSPVWSLKLHVLVTSVSDFVVRSLFVRRIYTLSHGNKLITGSILGLSVVDLVVGTIITARAFRIPTFAGLTAVAHLFYLNFASNIAADTGVAVVLSYYLWSNRTGSRRTDSLVVKLILYTVNTGLVTVVDASLGLICYAVMPSSFVFIAFYLNLSKFYVNSYLASLNVRKTLLTSMNTTGAGHRDDAFVSVHLSHTGAPGVSQSMPAFRSMSATGLNVSVPGLLSAPERNGYGHGRRAYDALDLDLDLDLDTGIGTGTETGTGSAHSKGDTSTAVNTPVDGDGSLLGKGEVGVGVVGMIGYPPGILVGTDKHGELDPEVCYEPPPEDESPEKEKEKDLESASEPPSPIDR